MVKARSPIALRELLLIVFFAAFLVGTRIAMRWHLHLPGHAMLAAAFGLVLVRSCVDRRAAASLCGLVAGIGIAGLGLGQGGPLVVLKLALPGLAIDLGFGLARGLGHPGGGPIPIVAGAVLGASAGVLGSVPLVLVEALAGVATELIALHALASAGGKALFGALGGGAAAWVARELAHHGLLGEGGVSAT